MQISPGYTTHLLNTLEADIQTVIDASIPNKGQNRAASKMATAYFSKAKNDVTEHFGNLPSEEINGLVDVYRHEDGDHDVVLR